MSIGALSQATGVPVGTLRSWEQRYGFPTPERLESGHRRYDLDHVGRLRLIREALDKGNRASDVVPASEDVLRLLAGAQPGKGPTIVATASSDAHVGRIMRATLRLDGAGIDLALQGALDELGIRRFTHDCLLPFLRSIGVAWAEGRLGVMHEHFASDRIRALIDERRRTHPGPRAIVCAALQGEHHDLGLHIGALLLSVMRLPVVFLGGDTPVEDVAAAVAQLDARGVLIGSSSATSANVLVPQLASLRRIVPPQVRIAVGGAARVSPGVELLYDFVALETWAAGLATDELQQT